MTTFMFPDEQIDDSLNPAEQKLIRAITKKKSDSNLEILSFNLLRPKVKILRFKSEKSEL